jgi:hypothetical protein
MRPRRFAFRLLTVASLLLLIAIVGLWAQSNKQIDQFTFHPYRIYRADSGDGVLCLEYFHLVQRSRPVRIIPITGGQKLVALDDFQEKQISYGESEFARKRAAAPFASPWWGKSADWRIVPFVNRLSQVVWVRIDIPELPQTTRIAMTIDDKIDGYTEIRTQTQELAVGRAIWLPYWFLLLPCTIFPLLSTRHWFIARRKQDLTAQNRCPVCGYDLRATPTRCPECGHGW